MMADKGPGIAFLDVTVERGDNITQEAKLKIIGKLRPEWRADDILVEVFSGGYLNSMISFNHQSDESKSDAIVVRVHGELKDLFNVYDADREFVAMQVSHAAGCFPGLLAVFNNGLAYTRAPGSTLKMADMQDETIVRNITRKLAALHEVDVDAIPLYGCSGSRTAFDKSNGFRSKMEYMIGTIPEALENQERNKKYQQYRMSAETMQAELDYLCNMVDELDFKICLCQLDTHVRNILYDRKSETTTLLDYELSLVTYEEMDIAYLYINQRYMNSINLLGEGPPIDEKTRDLWIRSYVKAKYEQSGKDPDQVPWVAYELARVKQDIIDVVMTYMFAVYTHVLITYWDAFPGPHFDTLLYYRKGLEKGKDALGTLIERYHNLMDAYP